MSDITINGKSLEEHLIDEKVDEMKEVIYDVHIQITKSRYHKPSSKVQNSRGRSGKVKVIKSKGDIFLTAFDGLNEYHQNLMAEASDAEQDKIWESWNKAKFSSSISDTLANIIDDIVS